MSVHTRTKNDDIDSKIADFMAVSIPNHLSYRIEFIRFQGY